MKIHFVCTHNTYRSRVAETYLKSLKIPNYEVSSSGIEANLNIDGPVTWYAQRIFKNYDLAEFEKVKWDQTTIETLKDQDLVVFMDNSHLDFCTQKFGFSGKYEVWNIEDFDETELKDDMNVIQKSEETFSILKDKINNLIL